MLLLHQIISDADIRRIERIPVVCGQSTLSGAAHRSMSQADPRMQAYVELVRQKLGVPEDATVEVMVAKGVPRVGEIVEHLAHRGVHRLALTRPRAWKANRMALREAEGA